VVPSAGSGDWDALFQEYQETMEKGKLLTASKTTTENLDYQTNAKETNEIPADALQRKPRAPSGCDRCQAKGKMLYSMEREPHGICSEFQTSAVLREMRDRYEEVKQTSYPLASI